MNNLTKWVKEQYEHNELQDIINHGCVSGCAHGLVYYNETSAFYEKFNDEIWDKLYDSANDQGVTIMELISSFNGSKDVGSNHQFKNLLAWFAVEETARELLDLEEQKYEMDN